MAATPPAARAQSEPSHTIRTSDGVVARIGTFRPSRAPTLAAASRAFGRASTRTLIGNNACSVTWSKLRLRILFANFGLPGPGMTVCSDTGGAAQRFTARGSRFRTWNGLRVGQQSEEITARHPSAEFRGGTWWLRTAVSPFGDEEEYPVVEAVVSRGRITAIRGWIGAAGD